jgi:hypothetical protein
VFSLIYSEAGAIEEEREKEGEEKLGRRSVLDNTQSPMIHAIVFANLPILLPLFPSLKCVEAAERSFEKPGHKPITKSPLIPVTP